MIRSATILFLFVASHSLFAQQALSDNINGRWCIYSKGERRMLDPAIHDLGNFDACGLSVFMRYEKYGIISDKGDVVLAEAFTSIKQLEGGYYLMLKGGLQYLGNWMNDSIQLRKLRRSTFIDRNWFQATFDSSMVIINVVGQKEWTITNESNILEADFGYVYCRIDTTVHLFDAKAVEVNLGESIPSFTGKYLLIDCAETKKIAYSSHEIVLPIDAKTIRIRNDEILYVQNGNSIVVNAINGNVMTTFPSEDISYYSNDLFLIRKNDKVGLGDRNGRLLIPINYTSISSYGGLFNVRTPSGAGIIDKNGKELVPCKYDYVVTYRDFFTLHNELDLVGIMSRKTGKILLPCDYSKMVLRNSSIRAFTSSMLRIVELDSAHRIVKDIVLSNVTSLMHSKASGALGVDERLYPLGWFNELVPFYDSLGFLVEERLKWGLKGENDSVLITPRYKQPMFVHDADFSLVENGRRKMKLTGLGEVSVIQMQVMSHRTGKPLVPEPLISLDTMDLLSRSYSRFVSEKGSGVLLDDDKILRVDYIDDGDERFTRYCTSTKTELVPAKKTDFDAFRYPDYNLNGDVPNFLKVFLDGSERDYIRFKDSEWNFLDTNGRTMFANSFNFAEPYLYETAIVLKDGNWGVTRADSFAIPLINSSVKRSPISDTLFIVQRKSNGTRFLDTNGRILSNGITQFYTDKGDFAQVQMEGRKVLIAPDYSVISDDTRFQKLTDNGVFYSKENKEYTIYNKHGMQLGATKEQPEEIWFEQFVMVKSRGKFGLLSMDDQTLIPFQYKEIRREGDYIFARDGSKNLLYDDQLKVIENCKQKDVLADSISGNYALIQDGKAIVYSSDQRKVEKVSGNKLVHFYNGRILDFDKQFRILGVGEERRFEFQAKSIETMGKNGCLIIDTDKNGHYFDSNWNEISFESTLSRAQEVGEGLAISAGQSETVLFGGNLEVKFKGRWKSVGKFTNGFLLLENGSDYQFVDVNGINQFNRTFDGAGAFLGKLAPVKETDGWTLINGHGHLQILPCFDKITAHSQTLFSTPSQSLVGLFDSHGNELIPVEYQQLNFLRNGIIQGRKNGEIFYFDLHGVPILLN